MAFGDSDEQLVKLAQKGDRDAFLTLYNRYLKKVYNRVKSRVPIEDAEDVTQDIFIAVLRSLPSFEQRSRFNTWLYTIVNRQIVDFYRKRNRQGKPSAMISIEGNEQTEDIPDTSLANWEDNLWIKNAINHLPAHYQEVLFLRFIDGLTFAEIASLNGQSLEATRSLYRRAVQAIRDKVDEAQHPRAKKH